MAEDLNGTVPGQAPDETVVIRKYTNRRLYDTTRSRCVTLADIADRVRAGQRVRILDARAGADVTRQVLAQVLCEREAAAGARALLDEAVLARLIRLSGDGRARSVAAGLAYALDRAEGANLQAARNTRRRAGAATTPAVIARLDALEERLKSLIVEARDTRRRAEQ